MQTIEKLRTLPEIDQDVAAKTGDEILLDVAKGEKVKRVPGGSRRDATQSAMSRAWTRTGNVD